MMMGRGATNKSNTNSTDTTTTSSGIDLRRVYTMPARGIESIQNVVLRPSKSDGDGNNTTNDDEDDVVRLAIFRNAQGNANKNTSGAAPAVTGSHQVKHRLDAYGFILNMDSHGEIHEQDSIEILDDGTPVLFFRQAQQNERRLKKWDKMMNAWGDGTRFESTRRIRKAALRPNRRRKLVVRRLRKGVPHDIRGQVWKLLGNVPKKMKQHKGLYQQLVRQTIIVDEESVSGADGTNTQVASTPVPPTATSSFRASVRKNKDDVNRRTAWHNGSPDRQVNHTKSFRNLQDTIERDIHRTFPRHAMFYEGDNGEDEANGKANQINASLSNGQSGSGGFKLALPMEHIGEEGEEDESENDQKDDASVEQHLDPSGLCGSTEEISMMIRELELSHMQSTGELPQSDLKRNSASDQGKRMNGTDGDRTSSGAQAASMLSSPGASSSGQSTLSPDSSVSTVPGGGTNPNNEDSQAVVSAILDAKGGQASLRRVLKAYSLYDREIGYCQGMNFIAGMFLTLLSEEEAFWLLVSVMFDNPCRMRGLFGEGMRETHQVLFVAEKLIQQFLPRLSKHLDREHIHITMFATQWLLTQYTSSFKFDLVMRVWDCFLFEGWKITYRVMLALLSQSQSALLKMSFEEILAFFRDIPNHAEGGAVLDAAIKIPLRRNHITRLEKEWNTQQQQQQR